MPSQLQQNLDLQNQTGPLSDFARTGAVSGLFSTPSTTGQVTTVDSTQQPQQLPWSQPLPTLGVQGKLFEEVITIMAVLTSQLDAVKFEVDTLATQNSILLTQNKKLEKNLDLVTKLVLVLGRAEHHEEMHNLVRSSLTEEYELMHPPTGPEPLEQVELAATVENTEARPQETTTVPRP